MLLSRASPRCAWLAIAATFIIAAAAAILVPTVRPAPHPGVTVSTPSAPLMRGAVRRVLTATAGIWLSYGSLEIIQPLYVRQILHGSVSIYAWTLTAFALGGLTTGLAASAFPRKALASRLAVPIGALAVAAGELAFTATASLTVALAGSALWGASAAVFTISSRSLMLSVAPPGSHGRAMTIWRSIQSISYLAPATIIGSLVLALGLRTSLHAICLLAGITGAGALGQTIIRPATDRTLSPTRRGQASPLALTVEARFGHSPGQMETDFTNPGNAWKHLLRAESQSAAWSLIRIAYSACKMVSDPRGSGAHRAPSSGSYPCSRQAPIIHRVSNLIYAMSLPTPVRTSVARRASALQARIRATGSQGRILEQA
jgi:hypothetical protein